jgi:MerR family transcriptional regulator, redox-sensitive transcriptional activator SoxR
LSRITEEQLTVAEIARRASVAVSHVRYYERAGLLPAGVRRPGRPTRYPACVIERLRVIGEAREAGLTLAEIRELWELPALRVDC